MSKSHQDPRSRILITDSPEEIRLKIMAALTDSVNAVSFDPKNRPGVSNLLQLLSHFDGQRSPEELGKVHANMNLRDFKMLVADTISTALAGIRDRYWEVMSEGGGRSLDQLEKAGAEKARASADATMSLVREAVGL